MGGKITGLTACVALLFGLGGSVAPAAEPPPSPPPAERALADLDRSLKELVSLVRQMQNGQRVELLMKRLEIKLGSLAPREQELRGAKEERNNFAVQVKNLQERVADVDDRIDEERRKGLDRGDNPLLEEKRSMETQLKIFRSRLEDAEQRLVELENDLGRAKADTRILEELIDRKLELE